MRTALPERLCADLVVALTGDRRGRALLEKVEAEDLFLRPLDDTRIWFRYHHLFVEFLRERLEREYPDEVRDLHQRAAAWFAANDFLSEAVDHALAAGDEAFAVDLVASRAVSLFQQSRTSTLFALLEKLPPALAADHPRLQLALGFANITLQRREEAHQAAAELERLLRPGPGVDENSTELAGLRWDSRVLKAGLATHFDVLTGVDEVVGACLERADSLPPSPVMRAACIDAFVSLHRFDFGAARRRQVWARPIYERAEGFHVGGLGMCVAAIAAMEELDGHGARRYLTVALGWSERGLGRRSNMAQMVVTQLGVLEYRLGQAEAAERCLDEAYESGESGPTDLIFGVRVLRPRLKAFHGDLAGAEQLLLEGAAMARERGVARLAAVVIEEQARLGLPSSGLEPAVPELTGGAQDGISIAIADSLAKARLHRILKHGTVALAQQALPDAGELLARTESQHRPLATVDARVLLAMMLLRAGKSAQAQESLITAVRACAGTGITSPITDGAGPVAELLTAILGRDRAGARTEIVAGIPNDLLRLLRQGAGAWIVTEVPGQLGPTGVHPEIDLLAREVEILRLLDTGCSNQQIAHALHLSTNTVKWYLKSLYAKLGVARRLECVAAARSAGLL